MNLTILKILKIYKLNYLMLLLKFCEILIFIYCTQYLINLYVDFKNENFLS
jgi:hypothetical protein